MNEELDNLSLDEAPPKTDAEKAIEFFSKSLPGPESVDALAETPLAYTEICEPLLKELYVHTEARKEAEKNEKETKSEVRALLKLDRGMIQHGSYGVKVTDTKGRETVDWKRFVTMVKEWAHNEMGNEGKKEIDRILAQNTTTGAAGLTLTPYVVGKPPKDTEE